MFRVQIIPWYHGYSMAFIQKRSDGSVIIAEPLKIKIIAKDETIEPFTSLRKDEAQVLMDDLWNCGIRPTEAADGVGELRAVKKHLEDMQSIVFKRLRIRGDK